MDEELYDPDCNACERAQQDYAELERVTDDLATLVRQLVRQLRKAAPHHALPDKAMDYLKRKGLQGTPLRHNAKAVGLDAAGGQSRTSDGLGATAQMIELLHTDCMTYMATLPDAAFDLAIVDPPYGRGEDGGTNRCHGVKQKNGTVLQCIDGGYAKKDWDCEPPPPEYFDELRRVARHQIVWGANYMPVKLQGGAIVWDKVNDGADQSGAEIAYCSMNERVDVVRYMWRGMMQGDGIGSMRQQGNKALNERRIHPTQKPVKLYEWLLQQYARPGMKVLDTHLGSGSIAIAAHYAGVDLVGCEIDADYWRAAKERFEAETRQLALLAPNV